MVKTLGDYEGGRRTLLMKAPQRLAIFDTSALTSDVVAALHRGQPSSWVMGMRSGTIRGFIPAYVWAEVPRVLSDRHREGGDFNLAAAEGLWWSDYVPLLYVVPTTYLPMTPPAEVLAREDNSDVGALVLAGVLAPVALIASDRDLLRSGLAHLEWRQVRAAVGHVRTAETLADGSVTLLGVSLQGSAWAAGQLVRLTRTSPATAALGLATVVGAMVLYRRHHPSAGHSGILALRRLATDLAAALEVVARGHREGEAIWVSAERGTTGSTALHQVARVIACAPEPVTRSQVLESLGWRRTRGRTQQMAGLERLLRAYPMFVEIAPGRWQVGRAGANFGLPARRHFVLAPPSTGKASEPDAS